MATTDSSARAALRNIRPAYGIAAEVVEDDLAAAAYAESVADQDAMDARADDHDAEYDDWAADAYRLHATDLVRAAYAVREQVGEMARGAYYDTTTYRIQTDVAPRLVRDILSDRDGHSMASYGSFGGYSTIGHVSADTDGSVLVESVYHVGD